MHKAIIAKIDKIEEIAGADTIQIGYVLGERVVISKSWQVGMVGILFPEGLQLSEDFCHHNNLYRSSEKNKDNTKKGFFEASRRVRSQPFMKVKSDAFFCDTTSLDYITTGNLYFVGERFDELEGVKICEKYISEKAKVKIANGQQKKVKLNLVPDFHKHVDTEQFKHYVWNIPKGALLSFHSKKHGTSFRVGKLPVLQQLSKWQKFVNKFLPVYKEKKNGYVVGTRNVIVSVEYE